MFSLFKDASCKTYAVSSLRVSIDPGCVPTFAGERVLENLVDCRVWLVLLLVHHNSDVTSGSSRSVEAGSVSLVLGHSCVGIDTRLGSAPLNVAAGLNRVVQIGVSKDGAMQRVPRSAKCAFSGQSEGGVRLLNLRVVNVDTLSQISKQAPCWSS